MEWPDLRKGDKELYDCRIVLSFSAGFLHIL